MSAVSLLLSSPRNFHSALSPTFYVIMIDEIGRRANLYLRSLFLSQQPVDSQSDRSDAKSGEIVCSIGAKRQNVHSTRPRFGQRIRDLALDLIGAVSSLATNASYFPEPQVLLEFIECAKDESISSSARGSHNALCSAHLTH